MPVGSARVTDDEVIRTVEVLSDFMRFLVRLPHSHGRTLSELGVLRLLSADGPHRVSDLAARQELTQPGMTQLITRMERAGLVRRETDPTDGRAVLVAATDVGRRVCLQRSSERTDRFAELYEHLEEEERRRLHEALPVLARLIEIKEAQPRE